MNKFWDKKYLKIVYHAVLFVALSYIAYICINFVVSSVTDIGGVFSAIGNFFGSIINVFLPLVIAIIFAFLFDPLVTKIQNGYEHLVYDKLGFKRKEDKIQDKIQDKKDDKKHIKKLIKKDDENKRTIVEHKADEPQFKSRPVGAIGTIVIFYGIIALIIRSFIVIILDSAKTVTHSSAGTSQSITNYFNSIITFLDVKVEILQEKLMEFGLGKFAETIVDTLYGLIEALINLLSSVVLNLGSIVMSISSSVVMIVVATVFAFYVMTDKDALLYKVKRFFRLFLPQSVHKTFSGLVVDIVTVFSGYVRGMLVDVSIIAALVAIALSIIGVPYAVIIGIISGFANFIPYLGSFTAAVLAILSSALTGDISKVVWATVAVIIIQQIDSYIVVPRALGSSVEISPFLVLLSLTVAGTMFGLVGMIIAVPMTAFIKILVDRLIENEEQNHSVQNFYKRIRDRDEITEE